MHKRIIAMLAIILASLNLAFGYDFQSDVLYCTILSSEDKTISVSTCSDGKVGNTKLTGEFVIPESINNKGIDYTVTTIGEYAFSGCDGLNSITIPSTVTTIGISAFYKCSRITKVCISDLLAWCNIEFGDVSSKPLSDHFFLNDEEIKDLIIPDGVTKINNYAFMDCKGFTSVTIPATVTSIGKYAFYKCEGLTSIEIPSPIVSIGAYAFCDCGGLTSVTIPPTMASIGEYAFSGCYELGKVNISDVATWCNIEFGYESNPLSNAHHLYLNDEEITDLVIPDGVTTINEYAFYGSEFITSLTIPPSVEKICGYAFYYCDYLSKVCISDLSAWCKIEFDFIFSNPLYFAHSLYLNNEEIKDLIIPNNITEIKHESFIGCSGLSSVTIPSSVTIIGSGAFEFCSGLTSITIPPTVTSIENLAFSLCSNLETATISSSEIGYSAFEGCEALTSVTLLPSVTSIENCAFRYCPNLATISISPSVTSIGEYAFAECKALTSISIPSSVTYIGNEAFAYCINLSSVTCMWDEPITADKEMFGYNMWDDDTKTSYSLYDNCILYVPIGTKEKYSITSPWCYFSQIIEREMSGVDDINLSQEAEAHVDGGAICVSCDEPVRIVAMNGATVYSGRGNCSINVAKGVYIVMVGGKSHKVAVI